MKLSPGRPPDLMLLLVWPLLVIGGISLVASIGMHLLNWFAGAR